MKTLTARFKHADGTEEEREIKIEEFIQNEVGVIVVGGKFYSFLRFDFGKYFNTPVFQHVNALIVDDVPEDAE